MAEVMTTNGRNDPMRFRLMILMLAFALLLVPVSALAADAPATPNATGAATPEASPVPTNGTVTGTVKNGTANGGSVASLTVTLQRFQRMNDVQNFTTTTGDDGSFSFSGLAVASDEAYLAVITYKDVEYTSDAIFLSNDPNGKAEITVYETTTDPSVLSLTSRGVVISGTDPKTGVLSMLEVLAIDISGDHTYVGADNAVLKIALPPNAAQVSPQPGFNFGDPRFENGSVLVTTGAITPGSHSAMIAYTVPYTDSTATLNIGTAMPTKTFHALVKDGTYTISSPSLKDDGTVNLGTDKFRVLTVDNPAAGDTIALNVSGLPKPETGGISRTLLYVGIGAGVALAAAAGLIFLTIQRRKRATPQPATAAPVASAPVPDPAAKTANLEDERLGLAAELNELDDRHAAGTIEDEDYESRRGEILEQLRGISRRMHGLGDAEV